MGHKLVLVLGAHRSGTSLLAKSVEVTGAELGDNLMPPSEDNPKGFMEDRDVFSLNQSILDALGLYWDAPTTLSGFDLEGASILPYREGIRSFLTNRCANSSSFSIKDPRLCLLLPIWLDVADELNLRVQFVVSVRNPLDVARSLYRRDEFPIEKGLRIWLNCYHAVLVNLLSRTEEKIFVSYESLLSNPARETHRLHQALNTDLKNCQLDDEKLQQFVHAFADKSLSHFHSERSALDQQCSAYGMHSIVTLFELLSAFSRASWCERQAARLLAELSSLNLEHDNFRALLRYFKDQRHEVFVLKEETKRLKLSVTRRKRELRLSKNRLRKSKRRIRKYLKQWTEKEQELLKLADSNLQATRRMDGQITGLETYVFDLKTSLSYRVGRIITWPVRMIYDTFLEPFNIHRSNLALLRTLLVLAVRHPVNFVRLVNRERITNAYITFFKKPGTAASVVGYYTYLVGGTLNASRSISNDLPPITERLPNLGNKPKVSVLIVNYNGRAHLQDLMVGLRQQSYKNYEIVIVDNCSQDDSVEWLESTYPDARVVSLKANAGFAAGNNIAAEVASGDLYCLLNNDTEVRTDWLEKLVDCLRAHPNAGAVGPKILFWKQFVSLRLEVSDKSTVNLDVSSLECSLQVYPKIFYKSGFSAERRIAGKRVRSIQGGGEFLLPVCPGQLTIDVNLHAAGSSNVEVRFLTQKGSQVAKLAVSPYHWSDVNIDLSGLAKGGMSIINNAGTVVTSNGHVFDRGFGEPDIGQFSLPETVDALCGCSILIRPQALLGKPIFADNFFAYFEDTDLSLRIRESGFDLIYCPESVVLHKHASTTKEYSPFYRFQVDRNRILFLALHFPPRLWEGEYRKKQLELNHLLDHYSKENVSQEEREFARMIPTIFADWTRFLSAIQADIFYTRERVFPRIAVYNNFWHTLGGAEHHAGVIAQWLQRYGPVDLISENDFAITDIETKFNLNLRGCRKRLVTAVDIHQDPTITQYYSLFVNSTFSSDLDCYSPSSLYVVSFPYKISGFPKERRHFVHTYTNFLCNSHYTLEWTRHYWGVAGDVLYPSVAPPSTKISFDSKRRVILNVGRFFSSGHCKKQLELVRAFIAMAKTGSLDQNWQLVLVGNVGEEDIEYLRTVQREAEGYPIEVLPNLALAQLHSLYSEAAIYWHATGLGENPTSNPDRYEHFGIATVEAMGYGCVPVVINGGGQIEIVEEGVTGFLFDDLHQLRSQTLHCIDLFENQPWEIRAIAKRAMNKARNFDRAHFEKNLEAIITQYLETPPGRILN